MFLGFIASYFGGQAHAPVLSSSKHTWQAGKDVKENLKSWAKGQEAELAEAGSAALFQILMR